MENEEVEKIDDNQDIDYKALYEQTKEEAEAKTNKVSELEGLIQKHKGRKESNDAPDIDGLVEKKLAENDFYTSNPGMSDYKEEIKKFTSDGLTLKQAEMLVRDANPDIAARLNTSNSNFTNGMAGGGTKTYSQEDLYNLGQKDPALKRQAMEAISAGKALETL